MEEHIHSEVCGVTQGAINTHTTLVDWHRPDKLQQAIENHEKRSDESRIPPPLPIFFSKD